MVAAADGPTSLPGATSFGELFATERSRLLELLATVGAADWARPTPCPEWDVAALARHLLGDDLSLLSRHRDGFLGTPAPEGLSDTGFAHWLDELQVEWAHAARRISPRLVVELLTWTAPQLAAMFARFDPGARTAHVSWAGPDPVPVRLDQLRELSEYWIHRQQLLQALDRPPDLRSDLLGPVLDGLRWAYPHRLSAVPAAPGDSVTIDVSGEVALTWHLVAAGPGGWEFQAQPGPRVVATLSLSADQAWRLLSNNLPAHEQAHLAMTGEPAITAVLRRTRAIIGEPN